MINALTTTDGYPYSLREKLGDKASDRAPSALQFPTRQINYAEDSAKVTIDAQTGAITFYKITDGPIVNAWERIYPDLFRAGSSMPEAIEAHLTYPLQWFHIQFDDVYKRYHQGNYIEFYNLEDLWDDADEVLGPIGVGLTSFGDRDESTFSVEGNHMLIDPNDLPDSGMESRGELEFAMLMPFTPEGTRNLRSLIVALQDPGRYGELYSFRIPQGTFVPGPEQADAMIDADPSVNQQLTLWVRHGAQVVAGHTLLLPVGGDVLYVQPIFVKSTQNAIPQLRLFCVVYKGRVTMDQLLSDLQLIEKPSNDLAVAFPFRGRNGIDLFPMTAVDIAQAYEEGGYFDDAEQELVRYLVKTRRALAAQTIKPTVATGWIALASDGQIRQQNYRRGGSVQAAFPQCRPEGETIPRTPVATAPTGTLSADLGL